MGCAEEMVNPVMCPDLVGGGKHCLDVLLPMEVERSWFTMSAKIHNTTKEFKKGFVILK